MSRIGGRIHARTLDGELACTFVALLEGWTFPSVTFATPPGIPNLWIGVFWKLAYLCSDVFPVLTFYDDLGGPVWRESEGVEFPPSGYAFEVRHPKDWVPGGGRPSVVLFSWTESIRAPGETLFGVNYWWRPVISDPFLMTISLRIRSAVNERFHCDQVFVSLLARRRLLARVSQLFPGESTSGRVAYV